MDEQLRELVRRRAEHSCEYCRLPEAVSFIPFEIDHIIAQKHGGATVAGNLALSCTYCNGYKGPNIAGIDPESRAIHRLFNPRNDRWDEHFSWNGAVLVSTTPIGRATIAVLNVNAPYRVSLRASLIREGLLPEGGAHDHG
jgi:hypothetical protein